MTPRCVCGEEATGLVVEGHLHPYCAWQAERARAERLAEALRFYADPYSWSNLGHTAPADIDIGEKAQRALAADREGRL
jgi:hypothetical protein